MRKRSAATEPGRGRRGTPRWRLVLYHFALLALVFFAWYALTTPGLVSEDSARKTAFFFGKPLQVLEGRYGPYVTDGETNASVPRGIDPAALSLDDARALIEVRRGAAPAGKGKARSPRGGAARGRTRPVRSRSTWRAPATSGASR